MPNSNLKCVVILSSKSSGSTALQGLLTKFAGINHINKTRHYEYETLYWTKAASVLQLPQVNMLDSEVPIEPEKARSDIISLLRQNLDSYEPPDDDHALIFNGWRLLCQTFAPVFVEKSPHHLHQWSALELIHQCLAELSEIDFFIIGLVRNPMAMLYSSWDRMRTDPEKNQYEWLTAYKNLLKSKEIFGDKVKIIKYEDMIDNPSCLSTIFNFIGVSGIDKSHKFFHSKSLHKWKIDNMYGFELSDEVFKFAQQFGYTESELENGRSFLWPIYRAMPRSIHRLIRRTRRGFA